MIKQGIRFLKEKGPHQISKLLTSTLALHRPFRRKQYVFLSHPIDQTGAPLVLINILEELSSKERELVRILAPSVTKPSQKLIDSYGFEVEKATHLLSPRLTGFQLGLRRNDYVFINTAAVYDNYRSYVFNSLKSGKLRHAHWFIHEDINQMKVVAPQILKEENVTTIKMLCNDKKLTIYVPSEKVKRDYNKLFLTDQVSKVDLRVDVGSMMINRNESQDTIEFLLSGTPKDGRKGQLIAIAAFQRFIDTHYTQNKNLYRDFVLHLVAIGDDYVSLQIKSIANSTLKNHVKIYPSMPREEALKITQQCNAVICCSLNETFALYVAEGMAMGHIVLRNDSAGMEEQLKDGVNGFYIDSDDVNQFAEVIEKVLNKNTLSNKELKKMGDESKKIIKPYLENRYIERIGI